MATLFLLGDSTCAVKEASARPETGWGEMFQPYLADGWLLDNMAVFRYTDPDGSFRRNLRYMIDNLSKKGVSVILASSISRRNFQNGVAVNTHFGYPEAMEAVAREKGIPFLEMTQRTLAILNRMGEEKSLEWFMNFPAGVYENYPEGKSDNTHLRPEGARAIARLVYEAMGDYDPPGRVAQRESIAFTRRGSAVRSCSRP